MSTPVRVLQWEESVKSRPFTSLAQFQRDLAILSYMREDIRGLLSRIDEGWTAWEPQQKGEWDVHGMRRRIILCDPDKLQQRKKVCIVGFFGERREEGSIHELEAANDAIVLEFRNYPGILAYSSQELPSTDWANLVVHDVPEARERWRSSEAHIRAANELAPLHYRTVRIHNGLLESGVMGPRSIYIERTKYWDYGSSRVWQAVRE